MRDRWALKEAAYKALGNAYAIKHSRSATPPKPHRPRFPDMCVAGLRRAGGG